MNKFHILMDKISTLSWIKHHEISICHKDHSWNIVEVFISFMKVYLNFVLKISSTYYVIFCVSHVGLTIPLLFNAYNISLQFWG
jgi:hypothetical protein